MSDLKGQKRSSKLVRNAYGLAAGSLAIGVLLGAFGAHTLKDAITSDQLNVFEIGIRYHMIHGLAMLILAVAYHAKLVMEHRIMVVFFIGILLFSGSLYLLATADLTGISRQLVGPLTPIGGIFFILGWLWLVFTPKKLFH